MYTLEVSEMGRFIDVCPNNINLLFIGDTGIGKTSVIENYCKENGYYLKTLILSQLEASETLGIPIQTKKEFNGESYNCLETAIPSWVFELASQEKAMLFLDEFLCAQPSVMNAFLNFLSQKRVGGVDLSHVKVVSATNLGNYTFEPDNNIISRFCMFYVVNTTFNTYIKFEYIDNNYVDETEKEGVLFEERSLKPRCQEQLKGVPIEYLSYFYEGFTNRELASFHPNELINSLITSLSKKNDSGEYSLPEEFIPSLSAILVRNFPKIKDWTNRVNQIHDIDIDKDMLISSLNENVV